MTHTPCPPVGNTAFAHTAELAAIHLHLEIIIELLEEMLVVLNDQNQQ